MMKEEGEKGNLSLLRKQRVSGLEGWSRRNVWYKSLELKCIEGNTVEQIVRHILASVM